MVSVAFLFAERVTYYIIRALPSTWYITLYILMNTLPGTCTAVQLAYDNINYIY